MYMNNNNLLVLPLVIPLISGIVMVFLRKYRLAQRWISLVSILAALGGAIMAARLNAAAPTSGDGYDLEIIAAAVIGGVSLMGGHGTVVGSVVGALIMGVVRNGLNLLVVSSNWQRVIIGAIILIAVTIDVYGKRRGR